MRHRPLLLAAALVAACAFPAIAAEPPAAPPAPPQIDVPAGMRVYYLVLLKRGPKWTPEQTEATQKIQEGHMANIHRMADAGKLVVAGPFLDGGDLRGIFIFQVATQEEAQ